MCIATFALDQSNVIPLDKLVSKQVDQHYHIFRQELCLGYEVKQKRLGLLLCQNYVCSKKSSLGVWSICCTFSHQLREAVLVYLFI